MGTMGMSASRFIQQNIIKQFDFCKQSQNRDSLWDKPCTWHVYSLTDNRYSVLDMRAAFRIFLYQRLNEHTQINTCSQYTTKHADRWWHSQTCGLSVHRYLLYSATCKLRALEDGKTHSTYLYSLILSCHVSTPKGKFP